MNPEIDDTEFLRHPNFRIASAFFSGAVFWGSLCYLVESPFSQFIKQRIIREINIIWTHRYTDAGVGSESDQEAQNLFAKDAAQRRLGLDRNSANESILRRQDNSTLIFLLTFLFLLGGLSQLVSSLMFNVGVNGDESLSSGSQAFCAFLIAWDSMSFQMARLTGLAILGLHLTFLGVKRLERLVYWLCIGISSALIIVLNALGNGTLKPVARMPIDSRVMALCFRQHTLAPSLVLSLMSIGQELYCIIRFLNIISPPSFPLQRRLNTLFKDIRIVRAFSLLVFDLIILVPNAIETTSLGDSLPFSIGALIVLGTFNKYHPSLPLFHDVAPQSNNGTSKDAHGDQATQYKALVFPRHPYSAAALASSSSQVDVNRSEKLSGFTTTSRSDAPLLNKQARLDMYSNFDKLKKAAAEKLALPPIPQEKPVLYTRQAKSRSSSRSRSRSRMTRTSERLKRLQLVRPIMPKAELARQFNDSERDDPSPAKVLEPRPPGKTHGRSQSSPIQELQPAVLRSNGSQTRRHSAAASTARTFTSASIRYGSDILRPEPGRSIRDRMRIPNTRPSSPAGMQPPGPSRGSSHDSWLSDTTVNALYVKFVRPAPSVDTFSGGWPVPPSTILNSTGNVLVGGKRRPGLPSTPAPAKQANVDRTKGSIKPEASSSMQTVAVMQGSRRPPSLVRGPRMPNSPHSIRPVNR